MAETGKAGIVSRHAKSDTGGFFKGDDFYLASADDLHAAGQDQLDVRHLSTHTAGFAACPFGDGRISTISQYQWAKDCQVDFAPGKEWRYGNEGYVLHGMILERLSSMKYDDYLPGGR
jgi:CubicO group peptidase (beta-lactamase class C family)